MADDIKDRENKDAEESGRPVQLDPEEQGGKTGQQDQDMQHDEDTQPEKQGSRSR